MPDIAYNDCILPNRFGQRLIVSRYVLPWTIYSRTHLTKPPLVQKLDVHAAFLKETSNHGLGTSPSILGLVGSIFRDRINRAQQIALPHLLAAREAAALEDVALRPPPVIPCPPGFGVDW